MKKRVEEKERNKRARRRVISRDLAIYVSLPYGEE